MEFELASLKRILGVIALAGLIGNHLVYSWTLINTINGYNNFFQFLGSGSRDAADLQFQVPYVELMFNPLVPFEHMNLWNMFNHLLAWPGLIAAFGWIIVTFAGRKKSVSGR